jgi:hypothetical protein
VNEWQHQTTLPNVRSKFWLKGAFGFVARDTLFCYRKRGMTSVSRVDWVEHSPTRFLMTSMFLGIFVLIGDRVMPVKRRSFLFLFLSFFV